MIKLHTHNLKTYNNLKRLLRVYNRVACVQPTGTGKSFIVLALIEENVGKKFLICSPSAYIAGQMNTHATENDVNINDVEFITYSKLAQMSENKIALLGARGEIDSNSLDLISGSKNKRNNLEISGEYLSTEISGNREFYMDSDAVLMENKTQSENNSQIDYIILDEFHRCGAVEWGAGIKRLLNAYPKAKIIGTSATPIRYLDNCRNMAEEIFHNIYAVNMSLVEAIVKNILPLPIYVTAVYSFMGEIERLRIRAEKTKNPRLKLTLLGKIGNAKKRITELDCGIDNILKRHIPNPNGKYIVFCPNVEKLLEVKNECDYWFRNINTNIHKYSVYFENSSSQKEFEAFKNDDDGSAIKLLFCIDMLNEGVHVKGVEGVIMLRATKSANVFYQQLGRALVCGSKDIKHPVIFDIVNNYETGDTANTYEQIMELHRENGRALYEEVEFQLYDYVQDIRTILNELRASFENKWESVFDVLCEFKDTYKRFPIYDEDYDGIRLGMWCSTQRTLNKKGNLSEDRVEKLNNIGFPWGATEEVWYANYEAVRVFYNRNNRFPTVSDMDENIKALFYWLNNQKLAYSKNKLDEDKAKLLKDLGYKLEVTRQGKNPPWEEMYQLLVDYKAKYGCMPKEKGKLEVWVRTQRYNYREGKLNENRIKLLNDINFPWDASLDRWENTYNLVKEYIAKNGKPPGKKVVINGTTVGQWFLKQVKVYNEDNLDRYKKDKLEALGVPIAKLRDVKTESNWLEFFEQLKTFINENGVPKSGADMQDYEELYTWLLNQKYNAKKGKLSEEHSEKLKNIGINIEDFASNSDGYSKAWGDNYNRYIIFVTENGRKPNRLESTEKNLYNWASTQRQRAKKGMLTDVQVEMLNKANVL